MYKIAQYEADDSQNVMDLPALKAFMVRKMNGGNQILDQLTIIYLPLDGRSNHSYTRMHSRTNSPYTSWEVLSYPVQ